MVLVEDFVRVSVRDRSFVAVGVGGGVIVLEIETDKLTVGVGGAGGVNVLDCVSESRRDGVACA